MTCDSGHEKLLAQPELHLLLTGASDLGHLVPQPVDHVGLLVHTCYLGSPPRRAVLCVGEEEGLDDDIGPAYFD